MLGKEQASLTKEERNRAKAVNFGIIYGISAFGLSDQLDISREEAKAPTSTRISHGSRTCRTSSQRTIEQAEREGYVRTLLGPPPPDPELRVRRGQTRSLGERLAVNTVMQGTAADIIKVAMVAIERRLRAEGRAARLVLQVHDELLLEAPAAEAVRRARPDPRGDVRRLRPRSAACRRCRRGRRLDRGEGLIPVLRLGAAAEVLGEERSAAA